MPNYEINVVYTGVRTYYINDVEDQTVAIQRARARFRRREAGDDLGDSRNVDDIEVLPVCMDCGDPVSEGQTYCPGCPKTD